MTASKGNPKPLTLLESLNGEATPEQPQIHGPRSQSTLTVKRPTNHQQIVLASIESPLLNPSVCQSEVYCLTDIAPFFLGLTG
jgi:hypothetical protein